MPAPTAAGLAMLPLYVFLVFKGQGPIADIVRNGALVAPWMAFVAFLMTSSIATYSWASLRPRRHLRMELLIGVAVIGGALLSAPWATLMAVAILYLLSIPLSIRSYARVKRQRAAASTGAAPPA